MSVHLPESPEDVNQLKPAWGNKCRQGLSQNPSGTREHPGSLHTSSGDDGSTADRGPVEAKPAQQMEPSWHRPEPLLPPRAAVLRKPPAVLGPYCEKELVCNFPPHFPWPRLRDPSLRDFLEQMGGSQEAVVREGVLVF